jgi:hypothetical protein
MTSNIASVEDALTSLLSHKLACMINHAHRVPDTALTDDVLTSRQTHGHVSLCPTNTLDKNLTTDLTYTASSADFKIVFRVLLRYV